MEWFDRVVLISSRDIAPEPVLPPTILIRSWERLYSGDFDGLEDPRICILGPAVPPERGIFDEEEAYKGFCEKLRQRLVRTMEIGILLDPGGGQEIAEEPGEREKGIIEWTRRLFSDLLQEPLFAFELVTPPLEETQVPGRAAEELEVEDFKVPASFIETPFFGDRWTSVSFFVGEGIRTVLGRLFGEGALILYPFGPRAITRRDLERFRDIARGVRERGPVREWLP